MWNPDTSSALAFAPSGGNEEIFKPGILKLIAERGKENFPTNCNRCQEFFGAMIETMQGNLKRVKGNQMKMFMWSQILF